MTAAGGTAYALVGDLGRLHDHNGLLAGDDEPRPDLVIVVVDNDGGGSRPASGGRPHFERSSARRPSAWTSEGRGDRRGRPRVRASTDVTALVGAIDDARRRAACGSIIAKVGDRAAEAALLRDVQTDVSAALVDLDDLDTPAPG